MFATNARTGFLPTHAPLSALPAAYAPLEAIASSLPSLLLMGGGAALAAAVATLPELPLPTLPAPPAASDADAVLVGAALTAALRGSGMAATAAADALLHALHRDYALVASAFLLEPKARGERVRARLPPQLARPLWALAHALGLPPFLEYTAYCLGNVVPLDASSTPYGSSWAWGDLRLVRAVDGGPEEATFIVVHAEIESHSGALLGAYAGLLDVLDSGCGALPLAAALDALRDVIARVLAAQLKMFGACDPRAYVAKVRPWIFGSRGNPDFDGGVIVFEGVSGAEARGSKFALGAASGDEPWVSASLRGETGAQSTLVPTLDAVLGVTHAPDALRVMLAELEHYRPPSHRRLLRSLRARMFGDASGSPEDAAVAAGVAARGLSAPPPAAVPCAPGPAPPVRHALKDAVRATGDREAVRAFNRCVALVRAFRDIHVAFAELYITRFSARADATGGTPYKVRSAVTCTQCREPGAPSDPLPPPPSCRPILPSTRPSRALPRKSRTAQVVRPTSCPRPLRLTRPRPQRSTRSCSTPPAATACRASCASAMPTSSRQRVPTRRSWARPSQRRRHGDGVTN